MRLLSMGRSLNEVKSVGRYHVPRETGLPHYKFGKPAAKISSAPAAISSATEAKIKNADSENIQAGVTQTEVKKQMSGGWLKRSNPFAPAARPKADAPKAPVQSELTLDKIKVVRNDLSDADYEVVPRQELPRQAELKPYRKPNKPAMVPANDELGSKAWGWLGSRLFGAAAKH